MAKIVLQTIDDVLQQINMMQVNRGDLEWLYAEARDHRYRLAPKWTLKDLTNKLEQLKSQDISDKSEALLRQYDACVEVYRQILRTEPFVREYNATVSVINMRNGAS